MYDGDGILQYQFTFFLSIAPMKRKGALVVWATVVAFAALAVISYTYIGFPTNLR